MAEPVVLSASSIATFLRCGIQWEFAYVYNIKSRPSVRQSIGLAFHTAVERNLTQKIESRADLVEDEVVGAFTDEYDHLVVDVEEPEEDPGKGKDSGIVVVRKHHREIAPTIQPLWVERPIQYKVNGVPYSGTIDLVDQHRRVRDWKTSKRKPDRGSYLLNMIGYALGYRHETGETEKEVVLDYLIRTKQPYYYPVSSGGPVPDHARDSFATIAEQVYSAIQAGRFVPNGLVNNACSWCGYQNICPAYNNQPPTLERIENAAAESVPAAEEFAF